MYFFFRFFKNEENLKKNTSTSGCIEKYISPVKMYKKIRNRKIELKKKIIPNNDTIIILSKLQYPVIELPRIILCITAKKGIRNCYD